jgi:hypothetical protein
MIVLNSFGTLGVPPEVSPSGIYDHDRGPGDYERSDGVVVSGFATTFRAVGVRPAVAGSVPAAIVEAFNYWFNPDQSTARWVDGGAIEITFRDDSGQTGVRRDGAVRAAAARAAQSIDPDVRFLLPGEEAPAPTPDAETPPDAEAPPTPGQQQRPAKTEVFSTPMIVGLVAAAALLGTVYYYQKRKPASSTLTL